MTRLLNSARIPESELVRLLRYQQERGFRILYDHYAVNLYGIALRIVRSEAAAQDILQEAFVKAWRNSHAYDPTKGRLFTWLLNIVRNTALDHWRSCQRQMDRPDLETSPDFPLRSGQYDEDTVHGYHMEVDHLGLDSMLRSLSPEHQLVLDYFYFRGYTHAEAAEALNMPLGTVKTRLRIAIRHLKNLAGEAVC